MTFTGVAGLAILVLFFAAARRVFSTRQRRRLGPAAIGSVYDLLNEDKRHAIEIIVEERAEARDPENADGNLPELNGKVGKNHR